MLEPSVKQRIQERCQQMNAEGKLLPRPQLEQFYKTFRDRFGPDKLASLDGEALLETMHAHGSKDSLVYWIEFKNDDEFPAQFGSISGGSAFKFGLFRRKETGTWVTADETNNAKDISVEEAVVIARKHRDQLLRGVEHLRRLPGNGADDDYRRLQEALDRDAPDVSDLSWGHKYFSLLFPDKLDELHSPDLQRFHLLKLLQTPPPGKGRYTCAGRFVAAAAEVGVPMNSLMALLYVVNGRKHRYWRVGTSDGSAPRNRWAMMKDGGLVAVGWPAVGDLSDVEATKESRERVQQRLTSNYPNTPQATGRAVTQIVNFVATMEEGDYVLPSDGGTVIGVGRVTGPYTYDPASDFPHRRPVTWLSLDEWKMPESEGLQTTVHEIKKYPANILEVERHVQTPTAPAAVAISASPPAQHPRGQPPRLDGVPGRVQAVLDRKSQCILYGPPGTGKTYWAERAALDLAAHWAFGKPFDRLAEGDRQAVTGGDAGAGLVRLCCFHPAYGYEDFIEGYRPEPAGGQIAFRLRDGLFKRTCRDAEQAPDRKFFVLVDEINRGDIPRIFGELLTVLEKDKRGKAVVLPVSGERFRVPPNVYLIGTMNTADRSISLLDAALRRRFGFVELMPDAAVLKGHAVEGIPLGPWLEALNRRICAHVGRDARNLQIGHSYLLQGGRALKDLASFRRALRDDILPLVEEYCYGDFPALQNIVGNGLLDGENQRIRHDLFGDGQEAALVQALLEPCPEVLASPAALASAAAGGEPPTDDGDEAGGEP
ncbi:AAA family ATPase [bacterium]|nr:AAA family ATPase [bacterium]